MPRRRLAADDPREWIRRARSNLRLSSRKTAEIILEDLCFNAQQAAEKAVKAVLIARGVEFPRIHDLARLLALAESAGIRIPLPVRSSVRLTRFAVATRYPGPGEPVSPREYRRAASIASDVVGWAETVISPATSRKTTRATGPPRHRGSGRSRGASEE